MKPKAVNITSSNLQQRKSVAKLCEDSQVWAQSVSNKSWTAHETMASLIVDLLATGKLRVLDVGCHQANLLDALSRKVELNKYVDSYDGIDLSHGAIEASQSKYPGFRFVQGNALEEDTYRNLSSDKNIIVCSGVCDFLSPSEIDILLRNFNTVLSKEDDSRIFINYRTARTMYGKDDRVINLSSIKATTDGGIQHYVAGDDTSVMDFYYHPDEFRKMVERNGFEVVIEHSTSDSPEQVTPYDHVCLKRKK